MPALLKKHKSDIRANFSEYFIIKIKYNAFGSPDELAIKHGIKPMTFKNWYDTANRAPKNDQRIYRIAQEVGCPADNIFEVPL